VEVSVRATFFSIGCGLLLLGLSGCGDDDEGSPHDNLSPDCKAIVDACHEADPGSGTAHDCHETGEANNAGMCTEMLSNCLSACQGE
jgi:hypothetical protein